MANLEGPVGAKLGDEVDYPWWSLCIDQFREDYCWIHSVISLGYVEKQCNRVYWMEPWPSGRIDTEQLPLRHLNDIRIDGG